MRQEPLWVERYRPKTLKDCILSEDMRETLSSYVDQKMVPNLLLTGPPGCGKTSSAMAMLKDLQTDVMLINGSKERGIDTLRTTLHDFAAYKSLSGKRKYIVIDEAEYLNKTSTQPAMRTFMEENSATCGFVLTCNDPSLIHEAIRSRCITLDFSITSKEKAVMMKETLKRVFFILKTEKIEFDKRVVGEMLLAKFPDIRNLIMVLQSYAMKRGKIDTGILSARSLDDLDDLFSALKAKSWDSISQWVADNHQFVSAPELIRTLFEHETRIKDSSKPDYIILIDDFQDRVGRMISYEVGVRALMARIMTTCEIL